MGNDPKSVKRWYLRCSDCLSVAVVESVERPQKHRCGACDGTWEVLGHVEKNWRGASRLNVGSIGVIPCDSRCTYAQGPSCDCPCGGENHRKSAQEAPDFSPGRNARSPSVLGKSQVCDILSLCLSVR
jgi:hypothetical protein